MVALVTRTRELKAILLKDRGDEGARVCNKEKEQDKQQCNAGQKGRAVLGRAVKIRGQSSEGEYHKWTVWGLSRIFGPAYIPKDLRTDHGLCIVHD